MVSVYLMVRTSLKCAARRLARAAGPLHAVCKGYAPLGVFSRIRDASAN